MEKLTEKDGIQLEEGVHRDLEFKMNDMTSDIRESMARQTKLQLICWHSWLEGFSQNSSFHMPISPQKERQVKNYFQSFGMV